MWLVHPLGECGVIARVARLGALGTIVLLAAAFVILKPPVPPGPLMRDFEAQYAAGATYLAGHDPYSVAIWQTERRIPGVDPRHEELLPFVGAPLWLPLFAALSRLPYTVAGALWGIVIAASVVTILLGSFLLAGGTASRGGLIALGALCVGFTPLISGISLGQEALPAFAGVIGALLAARRNMARLTVLACVVCCFKPTVAAVLAPLVFRRVWAVLLPLAAIVFVAASMLAIGGIAGVEHYVAALQGQSAAERFDVIQFTPFAVAYDAGMTDHAASVLAASLAVAAVTAAACVLTARRYTAAETVALAAAAFPLVCPFLHDHDLIVTLLPAMLCLQRARGCAWLCAACGALLIGGGWFGFSQGSVGLGFTLGLFVVAIFAVIALSSDDIGPIRIVPLALAPLAFVYGIFAIAHPIVFWPAALPLGFAVGGHPAASTVWFAEQRINGLEHPDIWWASLRAVSLAGCAALYAATLWVLRPLRVAALLSRPLQGALVKT